MNRNELLAALRELRIPPTAYSLDGSGGGECYCLQADKNNWLIYYSERGQRHSIVSYPTEQEANEKFLAKLKAAFRR